jgi:drug/metabolite transporter (DMT)-like permease
MPQPVPRNAALPFTLLFVIGALWGLFYVLIKTGVTGGVAPMNYLFWFLLGSGTVLLGIGAVKGSRPRLGRRHLFYYFRIGLIRFTLANLIFYTVTGVLPVGVMAVVMAFTPIFTYAISLIFRVDRLDALRAAGILCGFAGVLLIVLPRASLPDPALGLWVLLGFGAPLLHALAYVLLSEKSRPPDSDSIGLACGTLYAGAVMALIMAAAFGEFRLLVPPFTTGEWALITHAVLAGFNFYAIFELIRIAGATYMSQSSFLAVGFGVLFGILIFGERHSLWIWGAAALILIGLALVNARQKKA